MEGASTEPSLFCCAKGGLCCASAHSILSLFYLRLVQMHIQMGIGHCYPHLAENGIDVLIDTV